MYQINHGNLHKINISMHLINSLIFINLKLQINSFIKSSMKNYKNKISIIIPDYKFYLKLKITFKALSLLFLYLQVISNKISTSIHDIL